MFTIFDIYTIPLADWSESAVNWLVLNARFIFQAIKVPVDWVMNGLDSGLNAIPPIIVILVVLLIAWRLAGIRLAIFSALGLLLLGYLNIWELTMTTLAMIITAVTFCAVVGIPLGIVAARSDRAEGVIRPILDAMQTTPPFVYLIPVVMLFSIGTVSGVIATIIFALPPIIRLTNLGIRQVQHEVVEAGYAFGATPREILFDLQIPLAMRTIMAGLNQTVMLAFSMVVIAALIGAGGLGDPVRRGVSNLEVGTGFVGGIGIVVLAIILDRVTQALGTTGTRRRPSLLQSVVAAFRSVTQTQSTDGATPAAVKGAKAERTSGRPR